MKKLLLAILSLFIIIKCISLALSALSEIRIESEPLENEPHYSVVNAPLFVFKDYGYLRMRFYNNTDEAIDISSHILLPYKIMDKNGEVIDLDVNLAISTDSSFPVPVAAHGKHVNSYTFAVGKLPPGKYKMQAFVYEYGTSKEIFPSAEFEFYHLPIPFLIF